MGYSQDVRIPGVSDFKKGVYCQQCGYGIWIALQSAQFCSGCGFGIHRGCMENIMRTCVAIKAKTQPDFIMDICPERMLPQLKYRCVECDKKFSTSRQPRYVLNFSTILSSYNTVWKWQNFPDTQILREINFGELRCYKTAIFCTFWASEFG